MAYLEEYDISPEDKECVVRRVVSIIIVIRNVNHISDIFKMSLPDSSSCNRCGNHLEKSTILKLRKDMKNLAWSV